MGYTGSSVTLMAWSEVIADGVITVGKNKQFLGSLRQGCMQGLTVNVFRECYAALDSCISSHDPLPDLWDPNEVRCVHNNGAVSSLGQVGGQVNGMIHSILSTQANHNTTPIENCNLLPRKFLTLSAAVAGEMDFTSSVVT